jgi:hypothetical protein
MGKPPPENRERRPNDTWIRRVRFPVVSGKASAAVLVVCLILTALIIIPLAGYFQLPPWIRVELLLAVWWLIWIMALTRLLYTGRRVSDDHTLGAPRSWFGNFFKNSGSSSGWGGIDIVPDVEGCAIVLGIIFAIIVAVIGFWFLIEIAIPGIAFLLYLLVRGMLARVANDDHGCQGRLVRSLIWGCLWATVYMAPLALLVWLSHVLITGKPKVG